MLCKGGCQPAALKRRLSRHMRPYKVAFNFLSRRCWQPCVYKNLLVLALIAKTLGTLFEILPAKANRVKRQHYGMRSHKKVVLNFVLEFGALTCATLYLRRCGGRTRAESSFR
jgi:hypothetical protein